MSAHPDLPAGRPEDGRMVRVYRLGAEPGDDLSATTTPEERVALVWALSQRLWALSGQAPQALPRTQLPIRIVRPT